MYYIKSISLIVLFYFTALSGQTAKKTVWTKENFSGLKFRSIGPAFMSGRISDIAIHPDNESVWYVTVGSGNVWKTVNAGVTWTPICDDHPSYSIGCVTLDPTNPNTVWIGTGENLGGRHFGYGDGVYKSEDGGDTWAIKQDGNIVDFRLHTNYDNNSIIYAVGYNNNESKFYRSEDKGGTFSEISSIPTDSNRIILETTPAAPDKVYVLTAYDNGDGTYEGRNSFQGVYISNDAGLNFFKTAESDDIFGSGQSWYDMALTVSDTDPNIVFVGVLDIWRSTDRGDNFTKINSWSQRTNSFLSLINI